MTGVSPGAKLLFTLFFIASLSCTSFGQGPTSSLSGVVSDQTGAVIPGAEVTAQNTASMAEVKTITAENGTYSIPALDPGLYVVSVTLPGFKVAVISNVKIDTGVPATVRVTLEVGSATETVEVVAAGAEILQYQTATISTTFQVAQVSNLPLVSRNPLNFLVLMAGVNTPGQNRNSTINGLPTSAIDITLDGINIQDNYNKSTDGFYTRVPPSIDSIEEVSISTATPEAQGGAQGAVQIKFVTRQGSNEFHGSVYEYHRNPWLNSNYWFNNRDLPPDPATGKAPRARVLFNQYGFRFGGPIRLPGFNGRNKAFFFVNYEELNQPSQVNRQRTILSPQAQSGLFRYNASGGVQTVDLLALAARNGQTSTSDPVIARLLTDIRNATTTTGGVTSLTDPNLQRFSYSPTGSSTTKRPTVRLDFNATDRHHVEFTWNYLDGRGGPDFLNTVEPPFPGFPNQGAQPADRYQASLGMRSTLSPRLVNEIRAGLSGGPSRFNPTASAADFSGPVANQAGFNLNIGAANSITTATATSAPSRRNPLYKEINDTLSWTRGAHTYSFGTMYSWLELTYEQQTLVPTITFGVDTTDPANGMFVTANFPGASTTDLTNARNLYAVLTGRATAINGNARLDEKTGQYVYLGKGVERSRQGELGFFAQDSWRTRPNLTLNYGIRWEVQGPFSALNDSYTSATWDDLWGVSGPGNLFKPGVMTGRITQFNQFKKGDQAYNAQYSNFAPSFGFAWSPESNGGILGKILGEKGKSVLRGGYSIAYSRRGIGEFRGIISANPGATITTNRDIATGNLGTLPVLLRETSRLGAPAFAATPVYPLTGAITNSVNIFDPNIKVPYTESWTLGVQRELTKDTAVEVRYVGNRFLQGWTTYNLNATENNMVENGLLDEFKLAEANLKANIAAGRGNTFAYTGAPGTYPLPITLAYFSGLPASQAGNAANYTSSNFTSSTFVNTLAYNNPNVCNSTGSGACQSSSYTASLDANATFRDNAIKAGLPKNFMLTNPDLRGGANFTGNGGFNRYDAAQLEVRRRMSRGLLVQGNYQFAKAFSSTRYSFRTQRVNTLDTNTLRHSLKVNWVYELPVGKGRALMNTAGVLDRILGGWEFHGSGRAQTGQLYNFGNVNLVGMTQKELADAYKLRDDGKILYLLPQDIIDNTIKAFSTSSTSSTGYGSAGAPTGRYMAPAGSASCIQITRGECAPQNVYVTGPRLVRFDLSLVKRIDITERMHFELRGEFLNAFNNANFMNLTGTNQTTMSSQTFGQVTTAYSDSSNTNDPGGRLGQIVLRINW